MMEFQTDCPFCKIACGEDHSAEIVYEESDWLAIFPLNPATPGHTLVIPRAHIEDLWQLQPPLPAELMAAVIRVGKVIDSVLQPDGMNLITSAGTTAEQTVFHLHLHVVPRWEQDGFGKIWPGATKFENAELTRLAAQIRHGF